MTAPDDFPKVGELTRLQIEMVDRWHRGPIETSSGGILGLVCDQHAMNFRLWHQEDDARNPSATEAELAQIKRSIDRLNQSRNDLIEQIDDALTETLVTAVRCPDDAPINTETPGSAIDRLSIMALRLYHYREQAERAGVDQSHRQKVADSIALCEQQHADLSVALQQLLDDLFAGRKRHQTYRQLKMYNDPTLNPSIYDPKCS